MKSKILKTAVLLGFWSCFFMAPERFPIGNNSAFAASTTHVPAGGNLQTAIDAAQPGDTITLAPGATYKGPFQLRKKGGEQFITLTTAASQALPPPNTRMTPAKAANLPKLVAASNAGVVIGADPGAHHYRFVGLEISSGQYYSDTLVSLGKGTETTLADLPRDIELDRLFIHGAPNQGSKRGVLLNGIAMVVKNCYISDIKSTYQDSQAIGGWNGPGPFQIINNYLEAAGENILFGGAVPTIKGVLPSDIVIKRNHFFKQPSWFKGHSTFGGTVFMVKNLLELKAASRVTIEGNVFENCWGQAQAGYAIVFTVRAQGGVMPWVVVEDVDFVRNIIRNTSGGVNILGRDYNANNQGIARRILIKDNIFEKIDYTKWGGEGRMYQILSGPEDVTIDHNTHITDNLRQLIMLEGISMVRLAWTNNIAPRGYGVLGSGAAEGNASLDRYATGATFKKNAIARAKSTVYPAGNFFPASLDEAKFVNKAAGDYRLAAGSPYENAGTDGKDLGADIAAVTAATAGVTNNQGPAVGDAPSTVSVTPSSGEGISQTFQAKYSDADGADDISSVTVLFGNSQAAAKACYVQYKRQENALWLRDDAGSNWQGPAIVGAAGELANGQCTVNAGTAQVATSGQSLTLTLPVTFKQTFIGSKNIYLSAEDKTGLTSGSKSHGTWTPAQNQNPVVAITAPGNGSTFACPATVTFQAGVTDAEGESLTPAWTIDGAAAGSGAAITRRFNCEDAGNHTIAATATDSDGASGSKSITITVRDNAAPTVAITAPSNGAAFACPATVTFRGTVTDPEGEQLVPKWTDNGNAVGSGSTITRTYTCAEAGNHNIAATAADSQGASATTTMALTIQSNSVPSADSATPSSGAGASRTFQFVYSDLNGVSDIQQVQALVGTTTAQANACYIQYLPATNQISLRNDAGTAWYTGKLNTGVAGSLQNKQCKLDTGASSAAGSGATLALNVALTFKTPFMGSKSIFMSATDQIGATTNWQTRGTWAVRDNSVPSADSVTPSADGGLNQVFQFAYSDPDGSADVQQVLALFSTANTAQAKACYIRYLPATNEIALRNDAGTGWYTGKLTGAAGSLQNMQCKLDTGATTVTGTGTNLTLNAAISFKSGFAGAKSIFMSATDESGATTDWQARGTYTVR